METGLDNLVFRVVLINSNVDVKTCKIGAFLGSKQCFGL